ncbi:MAG TPA: aspartate--tRNA(Asn) ligase [Candidatus Dormibacteraeota bacterium]|nr:aspartate--tRNA(Asn) ligase [Candidatus Dormibacteraeota bacterium]
MSPIVQADGSSRLKRTHLASQLKEGLAGKVVLAGWVHDVRVLGGISFLLLRDMSGTVQVTAPKSKAPANVLKEISGLHQEDVVFVRGTVVSSKIAKKGIEVIPSEIEIVSKAETPLPLDPRGVTNTLLETRLNWRVLDFRSEESNAIFKIQSRILQSFRDFFSQRQYVEIQPPVIIASASEGGAELFSLKYFEKEAFLAQSPQLYKQMCAIAFEKVFAVLPIFRAEKFEQPTHLNEIRQMDIEESFATDLDVMRVLEEYLAYAVKMVRESCPEELKRLGQTLESIDLPLKRVRYAEAVEQLRKSGEEIEYGMDFSKTQEKKLTELVGKKAFLMVDWPLELKAFYAMPNVDGKTCKAFDLIYNGLEISSGTQRIHLPSLLIDRLKAKGLNPDNFRSYIDSFRYGAPYHSGWSIGLERLTMKVTSRENIREATMFPRDRNRITP